MDKMHNLIGLGLDRVGFFLLRLSNKLRLLALKIKVRDDVPSLLDIQDTKDSDLEGLFPHSFTTFKEGMASTNYCTRHDAAAKLAGWYVNENGHPLIEELVRAAEILLEDTSATAGDVSFLVGAWKDQASAVSEEDRVAAEEREHAIYERVAIKEIN